jgi:hypothetical protein
LAKVNATLGFNRLQKLLKKRDVFLAVREVH